MAWTARALEHSFPDLPWREPIEVRAATRYDDVRFACRFCICLVGLKGTQVETLPRDRAVVTAHIESEHPPQ